MVLMSAGKKARHQASIANSTKIFGVIGGLVPSVGVDASTRFMMLNSGNTKTLEARGIKTEAELKSNGLLSVNPQASGSVGKKVLLFSR